MKYLDFKFLKGGKEFIFCLYMKINKIANFRKNEHDPEDQFKNKAQVGVGPGLECSSSHL